MTQTIRLTCPLCGGDPQPAEFLEGATVPMCGSCGGVGTVPGLPASRLLEISAASDGVGTGNVEKWADYLATGDESGAMAHELLTLRRAIVLLRGHLTHNNNGAANAQ